MMKGSIGLIILVSVFLGSGCRTRGNSEPPPVQKAGQEVIAGSRVLPINQVGLQRLVKERNGKILFLNLWATWCAPCVEEFPDLVRLSAAFDTSEVEVAGISADYPDEIESKIQPFVDKHHVPFRMFVAEFDHQEDFINAVDKSWSGALPASMIYDRSGRRTFFHVGQGTFEQFKAAIEAAKRERR